ncbi:hypothetical protein BN1723_002352, partial [Verticillium longisporum]
MAFIEPRLIHLLNDATTPQLGHIDLPPFTEAFPEASDRPTPLGPTAGRRDELLGAAPPTSNHGSLSQTAGAYDDVGATLRDPRRDGDATTDRSAIANVPRIPLRLLLGETDEASHMYAPGQEADDGPEGKDDPASKKRHRAMTNKDDLMHLPQPVKKQKAASRDEVVSYYSDLARGGQDRDTDHGEQEVEVSQLQSHHAAIVRGQKRVLLNNLISDKLVRVYDDSKETCDPVGVSVHCPHHPTFQ